MLEKEAVRKIIRRALEEDIRSGDVTTSSALTGSETGRGRHWRRKTWSLPAWTYFVRSSACVMPGSLSKRD